MKALLPNNAPEGPEEIEAVLRETAATLNELQGQDNESARTARRAALQGRLQAFVAAGRFTEARPVGVVLLDEFDDGAPTAHASVLWALDLLGRCLQGLGDFPLSNDYYQQVLQREGGSNLWFEVTAHLQIARNERDLGNLRESQTAYRKFINRAAEMPQSAELDELIAEALSNSTWMLGQLEDHEAALKVCAELITRCELSPSEQVRGLVTYARDTAAGLHYNRGVSRHRSDDRQGALLDYEQARVILRESDGAEDRNLASYVLGAETKAMRQLAGLPSLDQDYVQRTGSQFVDRVRPVALDILDRLNTDSDDIVRAQLADALVDAVHLLIAGQDWALVLPSADALAGFGPSDAQPLMPALGPMARATALEELDRDPEAARELDHIIATLDPQDSAARLFLQGVHFARDNIRERTGH